MHRICNDVLHRCDDRPFDPSGRDHASDEFADVASDHRKPFYIRLQEDHFRKYCHRFLGMCVRARPFLSSECAFRGVYYSCPSPFLFDSESNKSGFKALKGEMKKGFYYIIALLIVSLFWFLQYEKEYQGKRFYHALIPAIISISNGKTIVCTKTLLSYAERL